MSGRLRPGIRIEVQTMQPRRFIKEIQEPGRQSGYTLFEVLTVLIIAGILATIAFHSYRQYKENALFDGYRYNMVLGVNTAKQSARAGSHKARLCAGFPRMVDTLKAGVALNEDQKTCNVSESDWKYGWYVVEAMPVQEGDDIVFTPMVTSVNEIAGKFPVTLTGNSKRIDFMSNGRIIPYSSAGTKNEVARVVMAAKHESYRMCKFVLVQGIGDVQSGECRIGSCKDSAMKACGNNDSGCASSITDACGI